MKDEHKTEKERMDELGELREQVARLEALKNEYEKANTKLQESEKHFRSIFDNAVIGIYRTTPDGKILLANPELIRMLGYTSFDELAKRNLEREGYEHEYPRSVFKERIEKEGRIIGLEAAWVKRDGTTLFVRENASAVFDENGEMLYYEGTVEDITERKRSEEALKESEEKYRQFVENSPNPIFSIDQSGTIQMWNRACTEHFQYTADEIIGRKFQKLLWNKKTYQTIKTLLIKVWQGQAVHDEDLVYRRKDGKPCYTVSRLYPLHDHKQKTHGCVFANTNITMRRETEERLKESEERYRGLFENSTDLVYTLDLRGNFTNVNKELERVTGCTKEELIGMNFREYVQKDIHRKVMKAFHRVYKTGKPLSHFPIEVNLKDETEKFFEISITVLRTGKKVIGFQGSGRDITERRQVEEELRENESRYRLLAENVTDIIWTTDMNLRFTYISPSVKPMCGYSVKEAMSKTLKDLLTPSSYKFAIRVFHEGLEKSKEKDRNLSRSQNLELEFICKDSSTIWTDVSVIFLHDDKNAPTGLLGVVHDITERKLSEQIQKVSYEIANAVNTSEDMQELIKSIQRHLSQVVDTKNFYIALYNEKKDLLSFPYFSDEKDEFVELPASKTLTGYVIKKDMPVLATREDIDKVIRSGEVEPIGTPSLIWLGVPLKIGTEVIGAMVVQSYTDANLYSEKHLKILKSVSGQIASVIERKRVEREVEERRVYLECLLEAAPDAIVTLDASHRIVEWNPVAEKMFGFSKEEVIGKNPDDLITNPDTHEEAVRISRLVTSGKVVHPVETVRYRKDGTPVAVLLNASLINVRNEMIGTVAVYTDIGELRKAKTEKEKIQAQLLQAQKMEAIGILAGGVAHDFNNLLTTIQGCTDMTMMDIDINNPIYESLKEVRDASARAADLTRQLLLFSRKHPMEFVAVNFNRAVVDMLKMLKRLIGEDISISTDLDPDLWMVCADRGTMEQVIMNLAVNARDAMPGGGKLTIKTENVVLDKEYCNGMSGSRSGCFVCLSMVDTGIGMDKETVAHIFEPFFSTKDPGKGTGLGLSVVYGIIQQHDGWVNVYSEPGKGTSFKIYIPALPKKPKQEIDSMVLLADFKGGGKRVLVVEDEESVRKFTEKALCRNDYIVFAVSNAWEALDVFEKEERKFDVVLSDVVLPDKSGIELVDQLLLRNPNIHVLLSSGYTDHKSQWPVIQKRGFRFLQKPYTLIDLLRTIKEI